MARVAVGAIAILNAAIVTYGFARKRTVGRNRVLPPLGAIMRNRIGPQLGIVTIYV